MHTLKRLGFLGLVSGAMFLSACGAKQGGKASFRTDWNDLYSVVPADAAWSFGMRTDAQGELAAYAKMAQAGFTNNVFNDSIEVLRGEGLLDGEFVSFQRQGTRWAIAEVTNLPLATEKLADHYRYFGGLEESRVGERVALRFQASGERRTDYAIDVTGAGKYLVFRYGVSSDPREVASEFRALGSGWPGVGTYASQGVGKTQRTRVGDGKLISWGGVDVRALNQAMLEDARSGGTDPMSMLRGDTLDVSPACQEANERIAVLVPSISSVTFEDARGVQYNDSFVALSARGVERGKALMPGAPSLERFAAQALLGLGVSFDYDKFLSGIVATPDQANCYGVAGVVGLLAQANQDFRTEIQFNSRTVSGTGAFILESVNLQGFIPTAELGLMVHSANPTALMDRMVRMGSKHGTATAISTATSPAVSIQLTGVPMRIRVQTGEDRVVVSTGGLHEEITTGLMGVPVHSSGAPGLVGFGNGPRLRTMVAEGRQYMEEMQMEDESLNGALELLEKNAKNVELSMSFESNGLRLISHAK